MTRLFVLVIFILVSCDTSESQSQQPTQDVLIAIAEQNNLPSLSASYMINSHKESFVYTNTSTNEQHIYGIGSTTKLLAAVYLMSLVEEERLSLDDSLSSFLPDHILAEKPGLKAVQVQHLLNHTAGISDYTKHPTWGTRVVNGSAPALFFEKNELISSDLSTSGVFNYSNSHYLYIEQIIEAVTGEDVDTAFEEYYAQLGYSFILGIPDNRNAEAYYAQTGQATSKVSQWEEHYGLDGGVYTDSESLHRLIRELLIDKTILSPSTLDLMMDAVDMESFEIRLSDTIRITRYGLGLMQLSVNGTLFLGHSGGTLKYQSFLFANPELDASIALITNGSGPFYNGVFFGEIVPSLLEGFK
ncbi:MAG: serine hydrolase domain-containing protein [Bacteroidota bacterium]